MLGRGGCGRGLSAIPPPSLLAPLPNLFLPVAHGEKMRFLFVLSSVAKNEKILTAELHLFRLWPKATDGPKRHHFCQVRRGTGTGWGEGYGDTQPVLRDATGAFSPSPSLFPSTRAKGVSPSDPRVLIALCLLPQVSIYQILDKTEPDSPQGQKLLASRLLSLQGSGWEVFAITQAVSTFTLSWVAQRKKKKNTNKNKCSACCSFLKLFQSLLGLQCKLLSTLFPATPRHVACGEG